MKRIRVEVVYALPNAQDLVALELERGASARDAVERSGLLARHREIDCATLKLGISGKAVPPGRLLADGERIEILQSLAVDPKEARRRRARR